MRKQLVMALMVLAIAVPSLAGCTHESSVAQDRDRTLGQNIDDATITAAVKAKLVADKPANLTRVDVDTNNATVYLNGVVESAEQKARAEQLAWQAKGVKSVVNNLQVKK